MSAKMKIGSLTLHHGIALAPMEEHTHLPFRLMARQYGAGLMFTERVDGDKVAGGDRRALRQLATKPAEQPCIAQVSGTDPEVMAAAARVKLPRFATLQKPRSCCHSINNPNIFYKIN